MLSRLSPINASFLRVGVVATLASALLSGWIGYGLYRRVVEHAPTGNLGSRRFTA